MPRGNPRSNCMPSPTGLYILEDRKQRYLPSGSKTGEKSYRTGRVTGWTSPVARFQILMTDWRGFAEQEYAAHAPSADQLKLPIKGLDLS
jgi:hypothetical protein